MFMKVRLYHATAAHLEMSTNRWAQHAYVLFIKCILITQSNLCNMWNRPIWLPCTISCFKCQISNRVDVTEPDPNPSIISKYLSEPSGLVGSRRAWVGYPIRSCSAAVTYETRLLSMFWSVILWAIARSIQVCREHVLIQLSSSGLT